MESKKVFNSPFPHSISLTMEIFWQHPSRRCWKERGREWGEKIVGVKGNFLGRQHENMKISKAWKTFPINNCSGLVEFYEKYKSTKHFLAKWERIKNASTSHCYKILKKFLKAHFNSIFDSPLDVLRFQTSMNLQKYS